MRAWIGFREVRPPHPNPLPREQGGGHGRATFNVAHPTSNAGERGYNCGALVVGRARKIHWKANSLGRSLMARCWVRRAVLKRREPSARFQISSKGTPVAEVRCTRRPADSSKAVAVLRVKKWRWVRSRGPRS